MTPPVLANDVCSWSDLDNSPRNMEIWSSDKPLSISNKPIGGAHSRSHIYGVDDQNSAPENWISKIAYCLISIIMWFIWYIINYFDIFWNGINPQPRPGSIDIQDHPSIRLGSMDGIPVGRSWWPYLAPVPTNINNCSANWQYQVPWQYVTLAIT